MIEKGIYTPAAELTTLEKDAYDNLYEKGGLLMTTEDGGESIHPSDIPHSVYGPSNLSPPPIIIPFTSMQESTSWQTQSQPYCH